MMRSSGTSSRMPNTISGRSTTDKWDMSTSAGSAISVEHRMTICSLVVWQRRVRSGVSASSSMRMCRKLFIYIYARHFSS